MPITAKLDELGKPAWIALIVLGFMVWWPIGLSVLAFTIWSGRMGCGYYGGHDRWQNKMERMQHKMDWMRSRMSGGRGAAAGTTRRRAATAPSTNTGPTRCAGSRKSSVEFREFLDRLRFAKDKTEFDQFMAERRNRQMPDTAAPRIEWYVSLKNKAAPFGRPLLLAAF